MALLSKSAIAAVAVSAGLAAGAAGVALADNSTSATPTAAPTAAPNDRPGPGTPGGPGAPLGKRLRGGPGMGMGVGGALHGELVVPGPGGGYQTVLIQRGKVTAVSSTSITLKSDDGFTSTYIVTADTMVNAARDGIATIKKGADANVLAVKKAGKATALRIGDRSLQKQFRDKFRGPLAPKPAASAPTT
ncbi:MAG: hypothetical protein QOJ90_1901 [Actinomycetota bacterium]|jgi:hypothetical protein|nr:hypothetical protein [Actinomycetota bacterium]MDQ1642550.1 hypothetical protein [Actinomycetota bacterium]